MVVKYFQKFFLCIYENEEKLNQLNSIRRFFNDIEIKNCKRFCYYQVGLGLFYLNLFIVEDFQGNGKIIVFFIIQICNEIEMKS